jgi:hypothetical protein
MTKFSVWGQSPIIVKIVESKSGGWQQLLLGSLGLTGIILLAAILGGLIVAAILFWTRSRSG